MLRKDRVVQKSDVSEKLNSDSDTVIIPIERRVTGITLMEELQGSFNPTRDSTDGMTNNNDKGQ